VLKASTSSDFDHSLTANGSLVPKLVIAMGRTYDQMLRALRYAAGCRSGDALDYPLRECVPPGCPEAYLYDRLASGSDVVMGGETAFTNSSQVILRIT